MLRMLPTLTGVNSGFSSMSPALLKKIPEQWERPSPDKHWHRQPALRASLAACRATTRAHASSFYFSSFPLPAHKKHAAYAVYAFCRWIDDVIDEADPDAPVDPPTREHLEAELARMNAGESALPFAPAFAEVNRQYAIPKRYYLDLIEGCCMDRMPVILKTEAQLEVYCYHVASVVGLMMSHIFGLRAAEGLYHAVEMGLAMQLTNILRDVREDFEKGRIYLPLEEMPRFQIGPEVIAAHRVDEHWRDFMRFQIDRARGWYASAEKGIALLDGDGSRLTAKCMARIYGGILDEIERADYDVFSTRRYVPTRRKATIALKAWAWG